MIHANVPTRYEIALWQGDPIRPSRVVFFGYSVRITKRVILDLLVDNGSAILGVVDMPEDFEYTLAPRRVHLNDGWTFGATGRTERDVINSMD